MKTNVLYKTIWIVGMFAMLLSACQGLASGGTPNVPNSQTRVYQAAQETLTAIPKNKSTATPPTIPTETPTPAATKTSVPSPTPTQAPYGPTGFPSNVDPLTGLVVSDPSLLNRRPIMVKVSNFPATGRPHAGLSSADIVFEYFIGEGMNRFMALFYGQNSNKVGPIRSGRLIDPKLVQMYGGDLAYSGAWYKIQDVILTALGARAIYEAPVTCPALCDDGRNTVESVFANTAKLTEYAVANHIDNTRPNLEGMRFDPTLPQGGQPADQVGIQFNIYDRGEWRYDPATKLYLRWIESLDANNNVTMVPLTDRNTGKQLAFANVVVLYAQYTEYAVAYHDVDMSGFTGNRKAVLYRDGKQYTGTWKSAGADKPLQFLGADGQPMAFKNGNTWMAIMGVNTTEKQTSPGKWDYQFYLP